MNLFVCCIKISSQISLYLFFLSIKFCRTTTTNEGKGRQKFDYWFLYKTHVTSFLLLFFLLVIIIRNRQYNILANPLVVQSSPGNVARCRCWPLQAHTCCKPVRIIPSVSFLTGTTLDSQLKASLTILLHLLMYLPLADVHRWSS